MLLTTNYMVLMVNSPVDGVNDVLNSVGDKSVEKTDNDKLDGVDEIN